SLVGAEVVFDAGVDVFRVLTEDDDVDVLRLLQRRRHTREVTHRTHALVEIQHLAHVHVERAKAAAGRRSQRTLAGNAEVADGIDGVLRKVVAELGKGFLACEDLVPDNTTLGPATASDRRVRHAPHVIRDLLSDTITVDMRDDGTIRNGRRLAADERYP